VCGLFEYTESGAQRLFDHPVIFKTKTCSSLILFWANRIVSYALYVSMYFWINPERDSISSYTWTLLHRLSLLEYSRINSTKSPASGAGIFRDPRLECAKSFARRSVCLYVRSGAGASIVLFTYHLESCDWGGRAVTEVYHANGWYFVDVTLLLFRLGRSIFMYT